MKKVSFKLIAILCANIILVAGLYFLSNKINHHKNAFIRLFPPHLVIPAQIMDLKYNSYYIAGATAENIYLGNYSVPLHILKTSYDLADTSSFELSIDMSVRIKLQSLRVAVDSPGIYLMDGLTPIIFTGELSSRKISTYFKKDIFFTLCRPVSPSSFIVRTYDNSLAQNILAKQSADSPNFRPSKKLLTKQIDGIFCTDGMLNYDPRAHRLIYLYYYRNQFLCLDTNMNVLYKGRTIDTITTAQITVAGINGENTSTLSSPPLLVNRKSCISDKYLFVNSSLIANNEDKNTFDEYTVIDVYNLTDGSYHFSFYLPRYGKLKVSSFRVFNNTLVALYDNFLWMYKLNF